MVIREYQQDGNHVIALLGALTHDSAFQFREQLLKATEATTADVVIDLAGVDYIDSTGLGIIVHVGSTLHRRGQRVTLSRATRKVARILELTHMSAMFRIDP